MKCIYAIININNGKKYIGSTSNLSRRKIKHLSELRKNKHHSPILQNSFNKHGEESFIFVTLKKLENNQDMYKEEQLFLDTYRTYDKKYGYNISKNAIAPFGLNNIRKVYQYSFTGELIKIHNNSVEASDIVKCNPSGIASCCRGKYRYYKGYLWLYEDNLESLEKRLYLANNKPKNSIETRNKMRLSALNRTDNLKPIIQMTLEGEFIKEWSSTSELCKHTGYSNGHISDCLNGKLKHARGFIWKFKNKT
jgi:group I intron endonuclease